MTRDPVRAENNGNAEPSGPVVMLTAEEFLALFPGAYEVEDGVVKAKCPLHSGCWLTAKAMSDGTRDLECTNGGREAEFAKAKGVRVEALCGEAEVVHVHSSLDGGDDPIGEVNRIMDAAALVDAEASGEIIIVTDKTLPEKTDLAIRALQRRNGDAPFIFLHGDVLVRVVTAQGHQAKIETLDINRLRHELARATRWLGQRGMEFVPVTPPKEVCEDVQATSHLPFPQLVGVRHAPYFTRDGQLIVEPGFNPTTRLYLDLPASLAINVPGRPKKEQVREAVALFEQMLCQFPWDGVLGKQESVKTASFANMLAAILTPLIRETLPENAVTPLFAFDAPAAPGAGKGLLAKIVSLITTGEELAFTPAVENDEEIRKSILAELVKGRPIVVLDNIGERISSRALASAMTASRVSGRMLGFTRIVEVPNRSVWLVTGNNLRFSGEMLRRAVWVYLDPKCEHPEDRKGWDIPKLDEWVVEHRSELVSAALTLVQRWNVEGRPEWTGTAPGSFEPWARTVGGILKTAEITGFLENRAAFRLRSDDEGRETRAFVENWWATHGAAVKQVGVLVLDAKEAMPRVFDKTESPRAEETTLGKWLSRNDGKVVGRWRIVFKPRGVKAGQSRYRDGWALEEQQEEQPKAGERPKRTPVPGEWTG